MTNRQQAVLALEKSRSDLQTRAKLVRAVMGRQDGTLYTNRVGYVWVRLFGHSGMPVQAFNNTVTPRKSEQVYVAIDPHRSEGMAPYRVLGTVGGIGTSMSAALDEKSRQEAVVGLHAQAHEWDEFNIGLDALNVHSRAIVPLRVQPLDTADMKLHVNPGYYMYGSGYQRFGGGISETFTVPDSGRRFDVVYLNGETNTIGITQGATSDDIYTLPSLPSLPVTRIALASILLDENTTTLNEANIFDLRPFVTAAPKQVVTDMYGDAVVDKDGSRVYAS